MADPNIMREKKYTIYNYYEILPDFNMLGPQEQDSFLPNLAPIIGRVYKKLEAWPKHLAERKSTMLGQLDSGELTNIDEKYLPYIKMLINNEELTITFADHMFVGGGSRKKIKTYRKHRTRKHKKPKSHKKRKSRMGRSPHKTRR